MKVLQQPNPGPPAKTDLKPRSVVGEAVHWLDEYTSPRPETAGNMAKPSFFQAAFNGATDGLYLFGLPGVLSGAGSASAGILVHRYSGSQTLGVAAGAVVGGALGAGICHFLTPAPMLAGAVGGALVGAFETLRGDPCAKHRDASNLLTAVFLTGPAKLTGSFGAMIGAHCENPWAQSALAAAVGAATGAAVTALIPGPVSIGYAALIAGVGAGIGPVGGARLSQLLRNMSLDLGKGLSKAAQKLGLSKPKPEGEKPKGSKLLQIMGTVPISFAREGLRAYLMSQGSWSAVVVGGVKESVRQSQVVLASKTAQEPPPQDPTAPPA